MLRSSPFGADLDDVFLHQTGRSLRDGGGDRTEARRETTARRRSIVPALQLPDAAQSGLALRRILVADPLPRAVHSPFEHVARLGVRGSVLELFLPGILCLLAFASGISMGFNTIFELQAGVIERFRVTPRAGSRS